MYSASFQILKLHFILFLNKD